MIVLKTRLHVAGLSGGEVADFMLNPTDDAYRRWWKGTHLQYHIVRRSPRGDHVGDVVFMDEYVGKHRLRMKAVVTEAVPGKRIVWKMKIPARVALETEDGQGGVWITHVLSAGWKGFGAVLDPIIRAFFSRSFAGEMEEHARTEFGKLKDVISGAKPAFH
jgi:uncharacterized protein YndB with AHSA1/START domain